MLGGIYPTWCTLCPHLPQLTPWAPGPCFGKAWVLVLSLRVPWGTPIHCPHRAGSPGALGTHRQVGGVLGTPSPKVDTREPSGPFPRFLEESSGTSIKQ